MIRTFTSWDEVKRAYGWTDHDPLGSRVKAMFDRKAKDMIIGEFQAVETRTGKITLFDIEAERFVQGAEFDTKHKAYDFALELMNPVSTARAKHLDHMIDLLSGIES